MNKNIACEQNEEDLEEMVNFQGSGITWILLSRNLIYNFLIL